LWGKGERMSGNSFEKVMDKNAKTYNKLQIDGERWNHKWISVDVAVAEHNKDILTLTRTFTKMLERKEKERDEQKNKLLLPLKEILEELRKNLQLDVTPGWGYYDDKIGTILKLIDEKLTVEC
jgi:predicted  nucleic acid-binding Zn-ribbon protein